MPTVNSPRITDLQRWMRWVLTNPDGVGRALKKTHPLKRCVAVIGETATVDRETRLSIYGNGYFSRIIDVLGANFSSVKNAIGEDAFDTLARSYLIKHPSTFPSIDDVGDQLSKFLKTNRLSKTWPFVSDLAAVEWAAHQSFFADDIPMLDLKKFRDVSEAAWINATISLDPSIRLLKSNWAVDELWRADGKWARKRLENMKKKPLSLLVYRQADKQVRIARLSPAQFDLLSQLSRKVSLGHALKAIGKKKYGEELAVQEWFYSWVQDGIIKAVKF